MIVSYYTVFITVGFALYKETALLKCKSCSNVTDLQDCSPTIECSDGEVCFKRRGEIRNVFFDLGCTNKQNCNDFVEIKNKTTQTCLECCSTDDCNRNLCDHLNLSVCEDAESYDCARLNSLFRICNMTSEAKKICPKYCDLCSIDGNWTDWSSWSDCDVTCENGTQMRSRSCTNPVPRYGGLDCSGDSNEHLLCQKQQCPVHGGWTDWQDWSPCSATCGVGMQSRRRTCTNPVPDRFGNHCFGDSVDDRLCYPGICESIWSDWTSWSSCSTSCDEGFRTRNRTCTNTSPFRSEGDCAGNSTERSLCYNKKCNYTDCYDILEGSPSSQSGVYNVTLWNSKLKIEVYCDMDTDNGGWTVFQYRYDGSLNFYRGAAAYEQGFGSFETEFWLGLKYVQEMASQGTTRLRLDFTAANGTTGYETFKTFYLDAGPYYTLHIELEDGKKENNNGIWYHNGLHFSTYDADRDPYGGNCAAMVHGAWWYRDCVTSNLNGLYVTPGTQPPGKPWSGMFYRSIDGFKSLKTSKMMFRRY